MSDMTGVTTRARCVRAAQQGDEHELRSLLKAPRGRFLAQAEDDGRTALEVAVQQGHTPARIFALFCRIVCLFLALSWSCSRF